MILGFFSSRAAVTVSALLLFTAAGARADDAPDAAGMAREFKALKARVAELEAKESGNWLTQERSDQIRQIVEGVLADSRTRGQLSAGPDFGYDHGFFIQSADQNFRLVVGGYVQLRYTFASDQKHDPSAFSTTPKHGDINGTDFRYARLTFAGNAFTPNLTYLFTGDFAGSASNSNDFQLVDAWVAYRFSDLINVRGGAFLVPFSRLEYISSGLDLVDFPSLLNPFDPARAIGISLYGDIIKDKLAYELNMNNGPQSNHNGRVGDLGGSTDNRLSFAGRMQYYGGTGKPADFADEADLRKDNSTLAWLVEGAAGYDSANTSNNAFPGKQGSESVPGVSTLASPGFTTFPVNGDVYRATIDTAIKYRGFEFTGAGFFQQINENPGAGVTSDTPATSTSSAISATIPKSYAGASSFFQAAYYGQVGYMINSQWEVVARAGQLLTEGGPNRMEEYTLGLNYYVFGRNFKVQGDVTYIPNEAAISNSTLGTAVNTQDLILRLQMQLKF